MDAGNMLEVRAPPPGESASITTSHIFKPRGSPNPKPRAWRNGTFCSFLPLREKGWG